MSDKKNYTNSKKMFNEFKLYKKRKPRYSKKGKLYEYPEKKCLECKEIFKPYSNFSKYCSITCKNRVRRRKNKEKIRIYNLQYKKKNPLKHKNWQKKWNSKPEVKERKKNLQKKYSRFPKYKKYKREWLRKKRNENIGFKIQNNIKSRIHKKLNTYKKHKKINEKDSSKIIKVNPIILKLINEMPNDYKPEKYHIDHINPLCSFDLSKKDQIEKAFAPENHRWITAEENLKKSKFDRNKSLRILK